MPALFDPLSIRGVTLLNRIAVSPMCQYSAVDGMANEWHFVHLGSRAVGGAGLVIAEASAVDARGRISPGDLGIYEDRHVEPLRRITDFIHAHGSVAGIQIAHAGRKASTAVPWEGGKPIGPGEGGWSPIVAPSEIAFDEGYQTPEALDVAGIRRIVELFGDAARRSRDAGFRVVEIHGAHGYLLHEFLSPLSNRRTDEYGGGFEGRTRVMREVVEAVRGQWPDDLPLFVRLSCTDWVEGGWDIEQSVELARRLKELGADVIDCSSGGTAPQARIPAGPGYQTQFASRIRWQTGVLTGAVGLIVAPHQADHIVRTEQADIVLLARELLRNPYWPHAAAVELHRQPAPPPQYARAW